MLININGCKRNIANKTKKTVFVLLVIFLIFNVSALCASAVTVETEEYLPRTAKDGRTVILHGDFSKNGEDKDIIVIPSDQKGNSKTVSVGANSHSSVGGWDSIEMDCFNRERGYYKTTLRLKGGVNYQFKMEQKKSAGIKDAWYGLDGYMSRFDTDTFNGGADANINIILKHDDDVTFYFIDGDRGSFNEWQPEPPHTEYNQEGTKFHLVTVSTKIRNNLRGLDNSGGGNNIFDNYSGGEWRWRDAFSPVWYSLTALPKSGDINEDGTEISATGELYMFRRTDTGEIGMYGKWQLDNDIEYPAKDKSSDYWQNAGAFFSEEENAPILHIIDPNGEDISFMLAYAEDDKQPRHEEGANNIVFEGISKIDTAGVYTYYLDELNLDGMLTDDAQSFTAYPRHAAQSIFLPTIRLDPIKQEDGFVTISGQVYGQNKLNGEGNRVYLMLTANDRGIYRKMYMVNADVQGLWKLELELPKNSYEVQAFADVFTPQSINPLSRNFSHELYIVENTDGINDLNTESGYVGQIYLREFIEKRNHERPYSAFGDEIAAPDSRIYEVETGTHVRSTVRSGVFGVNVYIPENTVLESPETGDGLGMWLIGGIMCSSGFIFVTLTAFLRRKYKDFILNREK